MKKQIIIAAIAAITAITANAQTRYVVGGAINGGDKTFTVAATAGTNVGYTLDVRNQASVPIQIELMADATGAYTFTLPIQYSVDGSVIAGMGSRSIAISFNGVTKQTIVTNVPTYGCSTLYIPYLTNATAAIAVTNGVLKAPVNWSAPAP